jgi:hypothetical protein
MDELQTPAVVTPTLDGDTKTFPRIVAPQAPAMWDEAEMAGILMPTEQVAFGSRPHPIVLVRPAIAILVAILAMLVVASVHVHPIVRGHHVDLALIRTEPGLLVMGVAAIFLLGGLAGLVKQAIYLISYRVVVTTRRVFVVAGIFGRGLRPLGNTPIMASGLVQSFFGRVWNYGTVVTAWGTMRAMRDPIRLYQCLHIVANGIEGDTWAQAQRTTIVP